MKGKHSKHNVWFFVSVVGLVFCAGGVVLAANQDQQVPAGKTAAAASTQAAGKLLEVQVLDCVGMVQHRKLGQKSWQRTKLGDKLHAGMELRTALRSSVQLKLHDTVVVMLRSATRMGIEQLVRQAGEEKSRVSVRYGTIRAGVIEGEIKSSFQIVCPAAVLSREGTWGIEFWYDPSTGSYRGGVDTEGLINVINTITGRRMGVRTGQYVTSAMQRWIRTAKFNLTVQLTDQFGTSKVERTLYVNNPSGATAFDPAGSWSPHDLTRRGLQGTGLPGTGIGQITPSGQVDLGRINYKFGNFGTGTGRIDSEQTAFFGLGRLLGLPDMPNKSRSRR